MPQANPQSTTSQAQHGIADAIQRLIALLEATRMNGDPVRSDSEAKGQPSNRRTKMKSASLRLASSNEPNPLEANDPLVQLGQRMQALITAASVAEDEAIKIKGAGGQRDTIDIRRESIERQLHILEDAVPAHRATTLAGAMVSLIRASALADLISDTDYEDDEATRGRDFRQLDACFYSILNALRSAVPGIHEAVGGDYYMSESLDPFECIRESERWIQTERDTLATGGKAA